MANNRYSSPFPTVHDTVGPSTLATPLYMPSSPPGPDRSPMNSPDRAKSPVSDRVAANDDDDHDDGRIKANESPRSSRASSPDHEANALDARLADYTIDFGRFHSGQFDPDGQDGLLADLKSRQEEEEEDKLSDVGGPEDFTANLERYLMGEEDYHDYSALKEAERSQVEDDRQEAEAGGQEDQGQEEQEVSQQPNSSKLHQPAVDDEPELGEYSEFAPVDMSTPSHLLRRNTGPRKDVTHLEDIEEDPNDEPETVATPTARKVKTTPRKEEKPSDDLLRQEIVDLRQAVQDRDEQLQRNHRRFLEATSAGEQIKHLQTELQRKNALLAELQAQRDEDNEEPLRRSMNGSDITTLQKQLGDLQKELQNRSHTDVDTERLENIAYLRQQVALAQETVNKRDTVLEETMTSLKEVTAAKEQQLREKNTEIDGLRAQIDDHLLEIEKLEADLDQVNKDYRVLEDRIVSLEARNVPLEEKNSILEADLSRAQSQVTAQENAIKAIAADRPTESGGGTYAQILDLIKDLNPDTVADATDSLLSRDAGSPGSTDMDHLGQELTKLQAELKDVSSARKALEAELACTREQNTESQSLIHSIESENTRLTNQVDELKSALKQTVGAHSTVLSTAERLKKDKKLQQPSPPPSPPTARNGNNQQQTTLEESHQAQLRSLQSAHTTAISTLRTSHADSTRKLRNLLAAAEKREAQLTSNLESRQASWTESRIESLSAEIQRLESVIAVKDETSAAIDQRIARSIEKREKEWERRVDLLLRERDRMSKALLWTWGEKELPNDKESTVDEDGRWQSKQAYRYKYAQKNGKRVV